MKLDEFLAERVGLSGFGSSLIELRRLTSLLLSGERLSAASKMCERNWLDSVEASEVALIFGICVNNVYIPGTSTLALKYRRMAGEIQI